MMLSETQPAPSRFLALPAEIRRMIYRRLLVLPFPLFIWGLPGRLFGPVIPHWLALLYTSRQISKEARLVLYGENQFIVPDVEVEEYLLEVFLNGIGPVNAGLLSHLRINFPAPEWEYGKWKQPSQANLRNLELLRTVCTNLRTLEGVYDSDFGGLIKMPDSIPFFREALFEINEQFRHNRSLREISVKIRRGSGSSAYAKAIEIMQKLGWAVVFGWPGGIDSFF